MAQLVPGVPMLVNGSEHPRDTRQGALLRSPRPFGRSLSNLCAQACQRLANFLGALADEIHRVDAPGNPRGLALLQVAAPEAGASLRGSLRLARFFGAQFTSAKRE